MMTLYGIPNCDKVKLALAWLRMNNFNVHFHDYSKKGVERGKLIYWCKQLDWMHVLNRRSRTWKEISAARKAIVHSIQAIELMLEYPLLIKRPVLELDDKIVVGFDRKVYQLLKKENI